MSRRRFFGGVSFAALGAVSYAGLIEPRWLRATRVGVPLDGSRLPLRVLHLSDLHASRFVSLSEIAEAIDLGLSFQPDLVCITGDFITSKFDDASGYTNVLKRLSDAAPTFACLGNHDGGRWAGAHRGYKDVQWITALLAKSGIQLLQNAFATAQLGDWTLRLVGLADLWDGGFDPRAAFPARPAPGEHTLLLAHNPDSKDLLAGEHWDLMLSGHTHGGQLRLPLIGTPFAPVRDKRFVDGLHRWNNRWLHITRGVGNVYGMRVNCPPEVSLLTLT